MEATGRIGGEPMSVTMIAIGEAEEEKKQKERQKKAFGGIIEANQGVLAKNMANIESYRSFNPYTASIVGGTQFSPIARTGQSMGLTTPDTHSKMFYHPDGRVQAVPGRMVMVNGEQKFLPNPQYVDFTTGDWSDTPPSQAKAKTTETPKEDRDDSGKSSFDFEAQRLQNENSLKVSAERLDLDPKVYAKLSIGKRFKLMGEEFKAMGGNEVDKDKINAIVEGEDTSFNLGSVTQLVGGLVAAFTGNPLIAAGVRILGGILSSDDDEVRKKDVKSTTKTTSSGTVKKSTLPLSRPDNLGGSDDNKTSLSDAEIFSSKTGGSPIESDVETMKELGTGSGSYNPVTREIAKSQKTKTVEDINKDMGFDVLNKGGLLNKPKRNPKKPRGKGLGSK